MNYYITTLFVSCIISIIYFAKRVKYSDPLMLFLYTFAPISSAGYYCIAASRNIAEAEIANALVYIGGCFLPLIVSLTIISLCKIKLPKIVTSVAFTASGLLYGVIVTNNHHHLYYKNSYLTKSQGISFINKEYGSLHWLLYILIMIYFVSAFIAVIYGIQIKREASLKSMIILLVMLAISIVTFVCGRMVTKTYETMPVVYIVFQLVLLMVDLRGELYNYDILISNAMLKRKELGYIAFDNNLKYLGADETIKEWFPIAKYLRVDKKINETMQYYKEIRDFSKMVDENGGSCEMIFNLDDKIFKMKGNHLIVNNKKKGYSFFIEDDTIMQKAHQRAIFEKEHDTVTGLYNDRKYQDLVETEYRNLDTIAILRLEIVNLNEIYDAFGGYVRDQVITQIASTIIDMNEEKLKGFRLNDHEMMMIIENKAKEESNVLYYHWLKAVEKVNRSLGQVEPIIACGRTFGKKGYILEDLLKEVEIRLYEDKKLLSKNQVE